MGFCFPRQWAEPKPGLGRPVGVSLKGLGGCGQKPRQFWPRDHVEAEAPKSQPVRKTEAREEESREDWREGGLRAKAESLGQNLWLGLRSRSGARGAETRLLAPFSPGGGRLCRGWDGLHLPGQSGRIYKVSRLNGK